MGMLTRGARWSVPLLVATFALTIALLFWGDRGGFVADVLALPIGVVGVLLAAAGIRAARPDPGGPAPGMRAVLTQTVVALIVVAAGAGAAIGVSAWHARHVDLTVSVGDAVRMAQDTDTDLKATVDGPWGGELVAVPELSPTGDLGDCVLPATVLVRPVIDGQPQAAYRTRHGEQVALPIPAGAKRVQLRVRVEVPGEQKCELLVRMSDTRLRR
ncbi:hypothetical protein [Catenuloplanes japonicus]|uniref:hypothetical protein n=1 Tax=Catenuloplanes japonicus TaxID=33876 RepID=UPI000527AEF6|nr:hypothetical protein [Catenuloplanes japonicus]